MKPIKYGVYSLLFVLSLVASIVVSSGTAGAASDYDDVYRTTPSVVLGNDGWSPYYTACPAEDYTTNWASAMLAAPQMTTAYIASFHEALENGRLMVSQEYATNYGHSYTSIIIHWTEDASLALEWEEDLVDTIASTSYHSVVLRNTSAQTSGSDCSPYAILGGGGAVSTPGWIGTVTDGYEFKNLFVYSSNLNIPEGYEGALILTEPPAAKYVAKGDSYTSGEGNPSFEYGTDVSGTNGCHRSLQAYPRLLQADLNLGTTAFVGCSGATTANITGGQWNDPPQIDALSNETEIVTLTIGGNDVGFGDYALGCTVACGPGSGPYSTIMGKINDPNFKDDLVETYEEILEEAPNADLYVADYPYLADENATTCQGLDFSGAYDVQEALNGVILDAVIEVGLNSSRIFMVQTNYSGSPFEGGHLCNGGDPLFTGIVAPPNLEYSLHPDADGQAAYAAVFEEAIG